MREAAAICAESNLNPRKIQVGAPRPRAAPFSGSACVVFLLVAMAVFGLFQALSVRTNADVAWYLYAGSRVLDGARLGHDIVEVNVPLIIGFSAGVEVLARTIGISALTLFPWLIIALSIASLAACGRISVTWQPKIRAALLLSLAYVLFIHVGGMVGQREHLLLIFVLPYVCSIVELARSGRPSPPLTIAIGIAATFGFALKPFFLLTYVAMEAYLAFRRRIIALWRPQSLAMLGTLGLFAVAIVLWTPNYLSFANESFALYRAYQPYGDIPVFWSASFGFVLLVIAVAAAANRRSAHPALIECLAVVAITLSLAVIVQGKGWHYQWYPATAIAIVLLALAAASWSARLKPSTALIVHLLAFVAVVVLSARSYLFWSNAPAEQNELRNVVHDYAENSILVLSSHLPAAFPLANETEVSWASRYPTFWQIPAFLAESETIAGERSPQEQQFRDAVVSDFNSARPSLVLVDSLPPAPHLAGFDYLHYFERDPRFRSVMTDYRLLQNTDRFRIYIRSEP